MNKDDGDRRLRRRRVYALRVLGFVGASYFVDAILLGLYWFNGNVPLQALLTYGLAALVHLGVFAIAVLSRRSAQVADQNFGLWQIALSSLLMIGMLITYPQVGLLFLCLLFVIFGFGGLSLSSLNVTVVWAGASTGLVLALLVFDAQPGLPVATQFERLMLCLVFMSALGRSAMLGMYGRFFRMKLAQKNRALAESLEENHRLATTDDLTAVLNRRSLMIELERAISVASMARAPLTVALLDLDHFKAVNDRFGHQAGDKVLREFSRIVRVELKGHEQLGRLGGEEFMIVMAGAGERSAAERLDAVRRVVAQHCWETIASGLGVTVSLGVAMLRAGESIDELLSRADLALYAAKRAGRDQLKVA